jgi:hypothetical protein
MQYDYHRKGFVQWVLLYFVQSYLMDPNWWQLYYKIFGEAIVTIFSQCKGWCLSRSLQPHQTTCLAQWKLYAPVSSAHRQRLVPQGNESPPRCSILEDQGLKNSVSKDYPHQITYRTWQWAVLTVGNVDANRRRKNVLGG